MGISFLFSLSTSLPLPSHHLPSLSHSIFPSAQIRLFPKALLFIFLLGVAHSREEEIKYQNQLEHKLCAECPEGYAIHKVIAKAGEDVVDRQWRWECEKVSDPILM